MAEEHSDYHDANSFTLKDLDQSTSTNNLAIQQNPKRPLKPVVQSYLKAFIKITRQETKAAHHLDILKRSLEEERPLKGLTPTIKHNISKAPAHLVINWNTVLHDTGVKLTQLLVDYWMDQKLTLDLEFEKV